MDRYEENLPSSCLALPQKQSLLLEKIDADLAEEARAKGCPCGGALHRADYPRKPRGALQEWTRRHSFCCANEGCRRRQTPASARFLGRRVYPGFIVVLMAAMTHGFHPGLVQQIREHLGIDARTLQRWRAWWLSAFVQGPFWKAAKARFMPPLSESALPRSLCLAWDADPPGCGEGLAGLMSFLCPVGAAALYKEHVI